MPLLQTENLIYFCNRFFNICVVRKKEITITPYGGLANRMRALNAVIEYARDTSIPVKVVWFSNFELNAKFSDIFELPSYDNLEVKEARFIDRFLYRSPRRHTLWLPRVTAPILFDTTIYSSDFLALRDSGVLPETILNGGRVLIESCYEFGDYTSSYSKNFVPTRDILQWVEEYIDKNFTSNTIGVHIRRTDNELSIKNSPLSLFCDAMKREIELCENTKFYVATDDKATKSELKRIFGNRILSIDTDCNRNSLQGIKDAVKEMWLLSRTSKIYGSFYSSYSEVASQLGGIPLNILQITK